MWVILPAKTLDKTKQRLATVLDDSQRRRLSMAMLTDVLRAVRQCQSVEKILVITGDADIARLAEAHQALVLVEPSHCLGLNAAVLMGVHYAEFHGAQQALVIHGDIPLLRASEVDLMAQQWVEKSVSLVPDLNGNGTNGLMLSLPAVIPFHYGQHSFSRHKEAARSLGLACTIMELPSLQLDIDSPDELLELSLLLLERPELATAQCLSAPDMQEAIVTMRMR